ncbi:MAG TPA: thioesterase family protein, partial [Solirubrobacteraceae bacterium]|nr:thioesterase family protein [Solirubrobacteraceae bacterium]
TSLDRAIALAPVDGGFTGTLSRDWWGGVGPHGGYLAAILTAAVGAAAGPGQTIRSLTTHYLEPPRAGRFELDVERLRSTRSTTTVALRLRQGDALRLAALAVATRRRSGPEFEDAAMPAASRFEETAVTEIDEALGGRPPAFARRLEYRQCIGPPPFAGGPESLTGGWVRFRDGRAIDLPGAALLTDGWWPAVSSRLREPPHAPTVDLTIHFRRPPPPAGEPVLAVFRSRLVSDGFMDDEGELWSADGRLLVQSRQLAVLLTGPG